MDEHGLDLRECALSELGTLEHGFARGPLPLSGHPLLVVRLAGAAGNDTSDVFDLASAIVMSGLEAWQPWALILDLRGLTYAWGDEMQNVLTVAQRWYEPLRPMRAVFGGDEVPAQFPVGVIVSDLNRDGLTSLVRDELRRAPGDILFESLEDAVLALDRALAGIPLV